MFEDWAPYLVSFMVLCIVGETWYGYRKKKKLYESQDTWTSIGLCLSGIATRILSKGTNLTLWALLYTISPMKQTSGWVTLGILFLLNEFVFYWFHRISHEVRFFWAAHVNHHSSMKLNFAVATRMSFAYAFIHMIFWAPLPLLGFQTADILIVETVSFFFTFSQHTTVIPKLGPLEWIFNTPSHHRVHHASNPEYINKNYGNVLIIYDRLFGTFRKETIEPIYGVTKNPVDRRFFNMIFHEWKDMVYDYRNGFRSSRKKRAIQKIQNRPKSVKITQKQTKIARI